MLLILHKSEHVRAAGRLSSSDKLLPQLRIKLSLTRLDSPPAGKFSYAHLQQVLRQGSLRVARFHGMLQLHGGNYTQLDTAPSNYKAPVFADSDRAGFFTTLSIGTPPVSFNAVVDTGSDLVWLQCQPCVSCFHNQGPNTIFDPSSSSSYSMLPCSSNFCTDLHDYGCGSGASCSYSYSYGDSSYTKGDLSLDALTLLDPSGTAQSIPSFAFGCGHDNEGESFSHGSSDGIVGLGLGPLSLPSQLGVSHLSYCLQSITDPTTKTSSLYLGEVAQVPPNSNGMTLTTQFITGPLPLYYVTLNGISVGGQLVPASLNGAFNIQPDGSGGMIFDSGTTLTLLQTDAYNGVAQAFMSAITLPPASNDPSTLCYDLSSASNIQFPPSLTFHFDGADVELPSANYFIQEGNLICLALAPSQSISIFGNLHQQNFFITYDLQAKTLSLTPTTCDSS